MISVEQTGDLTKETFVGSPFSRVDHGSPESEYMTNERQLLEQLVPSVWPEAAEGPRTRTRTDYLSHLVNGGTISGHARERCTYNSRTLHYQSIGQVLVQASVFFLALCTVWL